MNLGVRARGHRHEGQTQRLSRHTYQTTINANISPGFFCCRSTMLIQPESIVSIYKKNLKIKKGPDSITSFQI